MKFDEVIESEHHFGWILMFSNSSSKAILYPEIIRCVYSGQSDQDSLWRDSGGFKGANGILLCFNTPRSGLSITLVYENLSQFIRPELVYVRPMFLAVTEISMTSTISGAVIEFLRYHQLR